MTSLVNNSSLYWFIALVFAQLILNGIRKSERMKNRNEGDLHLEVPPVHEAIGDDDGNDADINAETLQVLIGKGKNWTHEQTLLLINLYGQEYEKMKGGKMLLQKLWQLVAGRMKKKGYDISASKCSTKMDALKRQYKKVIDHNNQSGNDLMTYKYFDELDEIFRDHPWVKPVAISSSEVQDSTFENVDERNSSPNAGSKPADREARRAFI
ncbi:PREDICTED: trihelix transcription factor GTL1-like [Wasmannia auropunctata]|uniref:trihelix transcription factor GTL1-like n=1 Tax=Wasmannia auropunctata TaxID=64793 RepID=UPI0005EF3448|nr:PREDICTED: trihelix transcription factor GTL1-like [Wasmannia auropunctata]